MLEFINSNSGALTVMFTGVVTISTVVYAFLTARLVAETRRMRQVQTEPKIEAVIEPREEFISVVNVYIRNIGLGPAYNISFEISAEKGDSGAQALINDFTKSEFLKTGIKYLGPGKSMASSFSNLIEEPERKIESILVFKICYFNETGKTYEDTYKIDLSQFKGHLQLGQPHLYVIAESLKKSRKTLVILPAVIDEYRLTFTLLKTGNKNKRYRKTISSVTLPPLPHAPHANHQSPILFIHN